MNCYIIMDLNTSKKYYFVARTPYEAMQKMIYTLSLACKCNATISKSKTGKTLYFEHYGHTYAVHNN